MAKYKVGDKVRIVDKPFKGMPIPGGMGEYLNSIMTIEDIDSDGDYWMIEDGGEWCWGLKMIAGLVSDKVELHPDFAEWYEEIESYWISKGSSKAFAIACVNKIGFDCGLTNARGHAVSGKYAQLTYEMQSNKEKYTRAILDDNWTVRKEKLYYVEFPHINVNDDKFLNKEILSGKFFIADSKEQKGYKTKFTEKEIKAIDERYLAFKTPVEED